MGEKGRHSRMLNIVNNSQDVETIDLCVIVSLCYEQLKFTE